MGKGRIRLSLRKGGITGRIVTITIDHEGILWDNQGQQAFKQSTPCFESQCIKFWRRLKMNRSSNDRIR